MSETRAPLVIKMHDGDVVDTVHFDDQRCARFAHSTTCPVISVGSQVEKAGT